MMRFQSVCIFENSELLNYLADLKYLLLSDESPGNKKVYFLMKLFSDGKNEHNYFQKGGLVDDLCNPKD